MRKHIYIIVLMLIFFTAEHCESQAFKGYDPDMTFKEANAFYENGEFDKAIAAYNKILDAGYESANIYFNLGNAYFKAGNPVYALLNYERAKEINPDDPDIRANSKFASNSLVMPTLGGDRRFKWKLLDQYYTGFTADEMLLFSSGVYVAGVFLMFFYAVSRSRSKNILISVIILMVISFSNLFIVYSKINDINSRALAVSDKAFVYYGPFDSATVFFKLNKGMEVKVLQEKEGWVKVRRQDGKSGWIKKDDIARI